MLIGIHGKKQHGKDTVATIIQYLTFENSLRKSGSELFKAGPMSSSDPLFHFNIFSKWTADERFKHCGWQRKAFAGKLKEITCLLIGCTMEQLESNEFKETPLGEEWTRYAYADGHNDHYRNGQWSKSMNSVFCSKEKYEEERIINWQTAYKSELTPRLLLQLLGTECGRNIIHPNLWVNATMVDYKQETGLVTKRGAAIKGFDGKYRVPQSDQIPSRYWGAVVDDISFQFQVEANNTFPNWLITDVRFPNEAEAIQKREDSILLKVERPDIPSTDQHESETALDNFTNWDYCIVNDGSLEHLIEKVKAFLIEFKIIE